MQLCNYFYSSCSPSGYLMLLMGSVNGGKDSFLYKHNTENDECQQQQQIRMVALGTILF